MIDINELLDHPFFTTLEVLILCLSSQLIMRVFSNSNNNRPTGQISKRNNSIFHKIRHWTKYNSLYAPDAHNVRKSWALKKSEKPLPREPQIPNNVFMMLLPLISNFGPSLIVFQLLGDKPTLQFPCKIPGIFKMLLQNGLKEPDNYTISAIGFYFMLNICCSVIIDILPFPQKGKEVFTAQENLETYANMYVAEPYKWELENSEEQLLAKIETSLKKNK